MSDNESTESEPNYTSDDEYLACQQLIDMYDIPLEADDLYQSIYENNEPYTPTDILNMNKRRQKEIINEIIRGVAQQDEHHLREQLESAGIKPAYIQPYINRLKQIYGNISHTTHVPIQELIEQVNTEVNEYGRPIKKQKNVDDAINERRAEIEEMVRFYANRNILPQFQAYFITHATDYLLDNPYYHLQNSAEFDIVLNYVANKYFDETGKTPVFRRLQGGKMKTEELLNITNPMEAQRKAYYYLGKDATLYYSTRKGKKYMILNPYTNKMVHFGSQLEDYTLHKDKKRLNNFKTRNHNWYNAEPYTPAFLSAYILW